MTMDRNQVPSLDPFEAALSRYLKASTEPAPLRLRIALEQASGTVVSSTRTRWSGRLVPFAAASTVALVAIVVGALAILGGPDNGHSGEVAAPDVASTSPRATQSETQSPTPSLAPSPTPGPSPSAPVLVATVIPETIATLRAGSDPAELVEGPRGGAIFIDRATGRVRRANLSNGRIAGIVRQGDKQRGTDRAISEPVQLTAAGPDVVIVDEKGRPWRWRPSNSAGAGTLARLKLQGQGRLGQDHGDVEAYDGVGEYRLYVAEPSLDQIMRYQQNFDATAFTPPTPYLASRTAEIADFEQLHVDFDVYALLDDTVRRHQYGRRDGSFMLAPLPDEVARGHDYRLVAGSGRSGTAGRLYLYDAANDRVVGFSKVDGSYLGEWESSGEEMHDARGMYVIEGGTTNEGGRRDDTLVWVTPKGIYRAPIPVTAVAASSPVLAQSEQDGASQPPGPKDVVRDDVFELAIGTLKATWTVDEPIEVATTLSYIGEEPSVTVRGGSGLVGFGIEQLDGPVDTGPAWRDISRPYEFSAGETLEVPFAKSGGFDPDGEMGAFWTAWFHDPELRLPVGTYRIFAVALYRAPEATTESELVAEMLIEVVEADDTALNQPADDP